MGNYGELWGITGNYGELRGMMGCPTVRGCIVRYPYVSPPHYGALFVGDGVSLPIPPQFGCDECILTHITLYLNQKRGKSRAKLVGSSWYLTPLLWDTPDGELWWNLGGMMGNCGELWGIMGGLWVIMGELWGIMGELWGIMGELWGIMGELWGIMGELWGIMGELWVIMGNFG